MVEAVHDMQARAAVLAARQRDHAPTAQHPFVVVLVDEVTLLGCAMSRGPACGTTLALTDDGIRQRKSGKADIQPKVPEPEVQQAATSPMHYQS